MGESSTAWIKEHGQQKKLMNKIKKGERGPSTLGLPASKGPTHGKKREEGGGAASKEKKIKRKNNPGIRTGEPLSADRGGLKRGHECQDA